MNMSGGGGGVCRSVKCPQHTVNMSGGGGVCVGLSSVHSTQMNMSGGGGVCRSVKCPQHTVNMSGDGGGVCRSVKCPQHTVNMSCLLYTSPSPRDS